MLGAGPDLLALLEAGSASTKWLQLQKYTYILVYRCFSLPSSPTLRLLSSNSINVPTPYATPV